MSTSDNSMVQDDPNAIAIIGMTGRFPEAGNLEQFWSNLRDGVDCVRPVSEEELAAAEIDPATLANPNFVKVASTMADIDKFDAEFFGVAPREAEIMDPQHRQFLECAWEALEHAGYNPRAYDGAIGIYAGTASSNYMFDNIASNPAIVQSLGTRQIMLVNEKDFLCGRVAFELDLRGPAVTVQTACSTSLVAVHMACQSILNGECDMALAGGVSILSLQKTGYMYTEGGLSSADGHCRTFDAGATGIVSGNGLGLVVLKSLAAALADGDTVHAVIRGSAINNDGNDKASFTAPSVDGQAAAITEAHAMAGVSAASISYVEAHGTGTMLGDPIEMGALQEAFSATTGDKQFCAIGSLKSNMGHLDVAAGVAGLIKTVLSLKHKQIPASLHFERPNPNIDFENSPFFVNTSLRDWPQANFPRRAGVSAFGLGGTNAHVVLEEAPAHEPTRALRTAELLLLAAKSPAALERAGANLARFLADHPDANLADVAFTLQSGREHFAFRRSVACTDHASAIAALVMPALPTRAAADNNRPDVVFMFPGGGTQYAEMGKSLYASEAVFRAVVDECATLLQPILGLDLRGVLFPHDGVNEETTARMDRTALSLPALFTLEYALVKQYAAWGVTPAAMVGHSLGEYVAACVAGVFSLPDALKVVAARGRLIGALPPANMLAVLQPADKIMPRLGEGLWLACTNSRDSCTISGTPEATEQLAAALTADGVEFQLLERWPASHSGLMTPILAQFREVFASITLNAPQIPYLSNLSGDWITAAQATNPDYWLAHLSQTVRFADCLAQLLKNPNQVYLEIGAGHTLSNLLRREVGEAGPVVAINTLPRRGAGDCSLVSALQAFGQLWASGARTDLAAFQGEQVARRIALPTYPFERTRYWITPGNRRRASAAELEAVAQANSAGAHVKAAAAPASGGGLTVFARPALPNAFVAPASDVEKGLCAIWEGILGVAPVGVHDDFFKLGGTSLIAIQLAARIRNGFQADMPLKTLFAAPTVAAQAVEIARKLAQEGGPMASRITPRAKDATVAMSLAQQRLWIIAQLDPAASAAYHISKGLRLKGNLHKGALQAALNRIMARHEVLRTSFAEIDGQTVQIVAPEDTVFAMAERDLRHLSGHELETTLAMINVDETNEAFDLERGPLIRAQLLQVAQDEHVLIITKHHIISDGWSIGVLVRELSLLYSAFSEGRADPLPPLAIQYADYAVWQRGQMQGPALEAQTAFWKQHLGGAPALLELPADRPRPAMQSYSGANVKVALSAELTAGLRELGARHGATLFMTLLAGWSALLSRLSGQDDVVVGSPVANRQSAEVENLIGFFVNTLALRVSVADNPSVAELLAQVKASTLGAYDHQDLPFEQVVEILKPVRSVSYSPMFQAMLNLHNTPGDSNLEMSGLTFGHLEPVNATAQCDMILSVADNGDRIVGCINYASDLFEPATVERMAAQLEMLLTAMVADDQQRVSALPILTDAERRQLLVTFNETTVAREAGLIHALFEARAAASPHALAVEFGDSSLTYDELNVRANRLAHQLLALGVQPDQRVALCVERSLDMVVGLLAILKAGGAYVPLDPAYPPERLAFMLADSAPVALLTHASLAAALPPVPLYVLVLDEPAHTEVITAHSTANPVIARLTPSHMAYVIYTSGSTGLPKGVMNQHDSLCNLALAQAKTFGIEASSRLLQFASFSFDASVSEIMTTLVTGATLVLASRAELMPGDPLISTLQQRAISHVTLPSSAVATIPVDTALPLACLIMAGDTCPPALAAQWSARCTVFNAYGPTEATVCATMYRCGDGPARAIVPIGKPMENTRMYILDAHGQLVPQGVRGELYIGGAGVARGYLDRAALTAERFIDDPFCAGGRMYRTGDQGRWLADGNIEFLGRNDFQVKMRGFRIELGEIESKLSACAGVREAVVLAREDQPGDKRLVAYVTPDAGMALEVPQLRAQMQALLPDYMVPSAFVILDELPLSSNGKLVRKTLPAPGAGAVVLRQYEAPQGVIEETIVKIWQELLGVQRIGRHDHFFELGGYSLLATQFVARIRDALGVNIALMKVFQEPTPAALAELVSAAQLAQYDSADIDDAMADLDDLTEEELEMMLAEERAAAR